MRADKPVIGRAAAIGSDAAGTAFVPAARGGKLAHSPACPPQAKEV
ncbi:hypothetical protein EDC50_2765 [Vulcaniibacterium tengchongense]|uniref:Uncharacterized protein n=1 Tax=Vulcaniibacterium tengchongense TaxID=1273429 RepID=A0A3N4V0B6_9GAMM|nr:hypothetical protein EDC50_2765 [Vulcaniibacterium tengchongense]